LKDQSQPTDAANGKGDASDGVDVVVLDGTDKTAV